MSQRPIELVNLSEAHWRVLRPILIESGCGLLKHYGIAVEAREGGAKGTQSNLIAGVVGFSGEQIRGTVTLYVPKELLQVPSLYATVSAALGPQPLADEMVADWVGELCNQLVGRFKCRLSQGLQFQMSTPATFCGNDVRSLRRSQARPCHLNFWLGQLSVLLECDGEIAASIEPATLLSGVGPQVHDGEIMLF